MSLAQKIFLFLFIVFVGMQFVPTNTNKSNKTVSSDFTQVFDVPINIENMLKKSCYDCHSNSTQYPWYSKIQPVAFILQSHVDEGKSELNFSEFGNYSKRKQKNKHSSIIKQIENDKMPIQAYTLIHRDAIFSEAEKGAILNWFKTNKL